MDEFAVRRGRTYATILIDMSTHRPVDVLADRAAATFASWLRDHPEVRIICRDRAGSFRDGAQAGAPQVRQVADAWHLLNNLAQAVERVIGRHRADLREPLTSHARTDDGPPHEVPDRGELDIHGQPRPLVARTRERHQQIHERIERGDSLRAIARDLQLSRGTVNRFARATDVDELLIAAVHRPTLIDDYRIYLHHRWMEGCTNASREIRRLGYRGDVNTVRRHLKPYRNGAIPTTAPLPHLTVRKVTDWIMRRPEHVTDVERKGLDELCGRNSALATTVEYAQRLALMVRERRSEHGPRRLDRRCPPRRPTRTPNSGQRHAKRPRSYPGRPHHDLHARSLRVSGRWAWVQVGPLSGGGSAAGAVGSRIPDTVSDEMAVSAADGPGAPGRRAGACVVQRAGGTAVSHGMHDAHRFVAQRSLVAAPTSSLPAPIGGIRNWDYRYAWIRDAAFAVFALRRIGFAGEADAFLGWVLDAFEYSRRPRIMYALDGSRVPDEVEDTELEGYQRSTPVRWGNGAADQRQHDVYGEILDCADQWLRSGGDIRLPLWASLAGLADTAKQAWRQPDQGIWEVRNEGRVFTYSAGMCHVALDRAATIGERLGLPGKVAMWRASADELRRIILDSAWDEEAQTLSVHLDGGGAVDASLLALPLRQVVPADHPRMVATTTAVAERLSAGGGLLYRYLHRESPDGLAGDEGAFVLCSFWMVDNLIGQGRIDEAEQLYASLCARASPLGLLSEQIDPSTGKFMGNFPQAFSHIGIIASGVNLARAKAGVNA
ncbi:glycoside hydrolase family 15 protein [Streptomyces sp. NPDC056601]|uniref:glycoside hydrolase family 15 protein n=1 Tax=Streptomyces sp. NPDC056601 TaxID=3345875 RepID=UPI0036CE67F8